MKKIVLEEGRKYGRLTIIKEVSPIGKRRMILCRCDCGTVGEYSMDRVLHGRTQSCGCIRSEMLSRYRKSDNIPRKYAKEIRHSRLYRIWNGMKNRCYTKGTSSYEKYGAKGVGICDEWRKDFMAFYDWALANGYSDDLQIDRINFRGNYEPSNCRWANIVEQANNKSNVVKLRYNGEEHTISEWSTITGIKALNIWQRINSLGWSIERALTTPERFIDNTRTEADTRIIKREIRRAAHEHTCDYCQQKIKNGEIHSLIHVSKNYMIHSLRLHFSCEDAFILALNKECGRDADKRWEIIKQKSIDRLNTRKEEQL